jgi:hypothetical protein
MTVRRENVEEDFVADYILTDAMRGATFLRTAVDRQYFYERSGKTKLCLHESTASQETTFLQEKLDIKYSTQGSQTVI